MEDQPRLSGSSHQSHAPIPSLNESLPQSLNPSIDPSFIDTTSPEETRTSFRTTQLSSVLPAIQARFPSIEPLYLTKIFRGTIGPVGLIWLDVGRQDVSPLDFSDLPHLLYCFEIYCQIICIMAHPEVELELQRALAEYRIRLLKISHWATFQSLKEWHEEVLVGRFRGGQDDPEGWREERGDLQGLLRRRM